VFLHNSLYFSEFYHQDGLRQGRASSAIDIRTIDRHPLASVGSLVLGLRCSLCPGSAPMPVITGLYKSPPAVPWSETKERGS
jgi:hypothetical protein